jgi:hypothetical protein
MKYRLVLLSLAAAAGASAQTIFFDNFSGPESSALNGTAPVIRPGGETWLSGTGPQAWKANGYASGGTFENAFLPFSPSAGSVYRLSFATDPVGDTGDWFALGFSGVATVDGFFAIEAQPVAWLLVRNNRPQSLDGVQTFLGPSTASGQSFGAGAGTVFAEILLDTRNPDWSVSWSINGTLLREASFSGGNPQINYVSVGKFGNVSGAITEFTLVEGAPVPEPSNAALLIGLLAGSFVCFPRRRLRNER